MSEKINDAISSIKGVIGEIVAEDALPMLATEMLKGTTLEVAGNAIGILSPRIGGVMVAYQQKRWERNWEEYINAIYKKQEIFNERLGALEERYQMEFRNTLFPLVSDYVQNEKQEEKIELIVTGLINVASRINAQEDIILQYYDILEQLSLLDIRVLKVYQFRYPKDNEDSIVRIMHECDIEDSEIKMVKEKLERLGLLQSKNAEKMNENIQNLIQFVEESSKGKNNVKLRRMNTIQRTDSYKITIFGDKFIKFFTEIQNKKEQ